KTVSEKTVEEAFVRQSTELVHIDVAGETISATPEHPFYVPQKGFVNAVDLRAGDILLTLNGEYVIVEQVQHEILESPVNVYNFRVADNHTYFVGENEVGVHNADCGNGYGKRINTPSSDDVDINVDHIIDNHTSTGNGAKMSGKKDLFPDSMTPQHIESSIRDAYNSASQVGSPQNTPDGVKILLQGRDVNGMVIEMWFNKTSGSIDTAYPIYGKKVKI
ncbi:MAG: EndoU domain-containing protein, partial [Oscillospiraceae bacterium]|nr:EndoU domain-containing protein [Oscillospiraceae bacterium]